MIDELQTIVADEIERYLRTGDVDPHHPAWAGGFMERAHRAHDDLRGALVREVRRLAEGLTHRPLPRTDGVALTRDLSGELCAVLFLDGFHLKVRLARRVVNVPVLAVLGVREGGEKQLRCVLRQAPSR